MAQLMNKLPLRGEYQIGLLLVLWQDSGEEWLSTLVSKGIGWAGGLF